MSSPFFPSDVTEELPCRLIRFTAVCRNSRRTQPARFRRLTAPETLEIRAIPGGSLLELLFGAPLISPFFALLGADSDPHGTRDLPSLLPGAKIG